jgi:hypothetical protein
VRKPANVAAWWYGLVGAGGFAFGLIGERRPFGEDLFAHPLFCYFVAVGVALLVLRMASGRPVPELISERALLTGCFGGLALFLAGNFIAVHLLAR